MKILFCAQCEISNELGASKVVIEVAKAMAPQGWECELQAIPEIHQRYSAKSKTPLTKQEAFRRFLRDEAGKYDVVDYDYSYLPFPRSEFSRRTLMVARSVLLLQHFSYVRLREPRSLLTAARAQLREWRTPRANRLKFMLEAGVETARQADMVTVPTEDDSLLLQKEGVAAERIITLPYGISWKVWKSAAAADETRAPSPPTLVFLGSFDYRKGCLDLVDIAQRVFAAVPDARLKLLGTNGMLQTEAKVRAYFPSSCQARLDVVPQYASQDLPQLMVGTTLGLFPSYLEGLPLGVVEMVAGGIPVLAYTVPGPSTILPKECLSHCGEWRAMADRAIELLRDDQARQALARQCWNRSQQFDWPRIGEATSEAYLRALQVLRG